MQEVLYEVEVSWQTCSVYPAELISDNMYCAADIGKDSCYVGCFSGYLPLPCF